MRCSARERDGHAHRRYPLSAIQQIVGDELEQRLQLRQPACPRTAVATARLPRLGRNQLRPAGQRIATPSDGMYLRIERRPRHQPQPGRADRRDLVELLWRLAEHPDEAADFASSPLAATPLPSLEPLVDVDRQPVRTPGRGAAGQRRAGLRGATLDLSRPRPCGALRGHLPGPRRRARRG
ncbi:hypothetical protein ACPA9J_31500 [Pseudomonas aeruginosa]